MGTYTWTGKGFYKGEATGYSWFESQNWDPSGVPGAGDTVTFPDADYAGKVGLVEFYSNATVESLSVGKIAPAGSSSLTVTGNFTWSPGSGANEAWAIQVDLLLEGAGTIEVSDPANPPTFGIGPHILTVEGELTISGVAGGNLVLTNNQTLVNNGTIILNGCGLSGGSYRLRHNGQIQCNASASLSTDWEMAFSDESQISIAEGATLTLLSEVYVNRCKFTGTGVVAIGEGAIVNLNSNNTVPRLTMAGGRLGSGNPTAPTHVDITDRFQFSDGTVACAVIIDKLSEGTVSGKQAGLVGGTLLNYGKLNIASGAVLSYENGLLQNDGLLIVEGSSQQVAANSGLLLNNALLVKADPGSSVIEVTAQNNGNIHLAAGELSLGGQLQLIKGRLFLDGGNIAKASDFGNISVVGGTEGGVLSGHGTVDVPLSNGGWVEPDGDGITFSRGYEQTDGGNLSLPRESLRRAQALVDVRGGAKLAGSLWVTA